MVEDQPDHPLPRPVDLPLGEAEELHVVVPQPLAIALPQGLAPDPVVAVVVVLVAGPLVAAHQLVDPARPVRRVPPVGRVPHHHVDAVAALEPAGLRRLVGEGGHARQVALAWRAVLQGVGEVEGEALAGSQRLAPLAEQVADLQVPDGVRRHHQLEGGEALQQVRPQARRRPRAEDLPVGLPGHLPRLGDEGQGAGGGIEERDPLVGEAQRPLQGVHQQAVDRADDVGDQGQRRVVDPPALPLAHVVALQEGLVEVDDRVAAPAFVEPAAEDPVHVGGAQQVDQILEDPAHLVRWIGDRDVAEGVPQDADGLRHHASRRRQVEAGARPGALLVPEPGAGGEQAEGEGLGVEVGELGGRQVGDQVLGEGPVEARQLAPGLPGQLPAEARGDHVLEVPGAVGQRPRQLAGGAHRRRVVGQEGVEEGAEPVATLGPAGRDPVAVPEEQVLPEVGEEEVREGLRVAPELPGLGDRLEVGARKFRLDVPDHPAAAGHDLDVRAEALAQPPGQEDRRRARLPGLAHRAQETGERRVVAPLARRRRAGEPGDLQVEVGHGLVEIGSMEIGHGTAMIRKIII